MKITSIHLGGWFQRTMLQLSEIYDFLRSGESKLALDAEKLTKLHKDLDIIGVEYGIASEEFVAYTTEDLFRIKIFESGLIILSRDDLDSETLFADADKLKKYYEEKLSPAINYLFSLGAPVPKELAKVENIYPYFIICNDASRDDIADLLAKTERQKYFEFDNPDYNILRGEKFYIINNKKVTTATLARFIETQVFVREFKSLLHRYLNLHRILWDKVDLLAAKKLPTAGSIKTLASYAKTAMLINGRIHQMSAYLSAREILIKQDPALEDFLAFSGFRYETLRGTLDYVRDLWRMTKNYISETTEALTTQKSATTVRRISTSIEFIALILIALFILALKNLQ